MLLRHIARPLLATWFIYDGIDAARHPAAHAAAARRGVDLVGNRVGMEAPLSERQVTALVRAHGVATATAGLCLALGKAPRAAAFALAALTVPLAVVDEPFTRGDDRSGRARKFVGDLGAIGGALIAAADLEGRPGVQWRLAKARHDLTAAREAKRSAKEAARVAAD